MPSIDLSPVAIPQPTVLKEIRTAKLRQFGPVLSGIDKQKQIGQLYVSKLGLADDEHDLTFHGGIDKAVHQYCSDNYAFWHAQFEDNATRSRFVPGGFGENLVADSFDETNVCIGDLVRIGSPTSDMTGATDGCILEVSLPRQPCFKLNQRFGLKNFAPQTHQNSKTGWYYRVKQEGFIEAGMEIRVVKRDHPTWSIARLHHYVHRDKTDMEITQELMGINVIGDECRDVFVKRYQKHVEKKQAKKRGDGRPFRVVAKTMETPRIVRLELRAEQASEKIIEIPYGSYAVIRLSNGLKRAYSVVSGTMDHFVLGVARHDNSRGGSVHIHDQLMVDNPITVCTIERSMEPNGMGSHSIFIVGGIGITAFLAKMKGVVSTNQSLELHYAVRTADDVAFLTLLSDLGSGIKIYDKSKGERMDIDKILQKRVWNSQVFTCGPQRMIDAVIAAAEKAGMTSDEVYYEVFSADSSGDPFSVDVIAQDKKMKLDIGQDVTLLEALREAGLEVGSSCETGNCGTCRVFVKCGKIDHRGTGLSNEEQKSEMLSCVSRGVGHIEIGLPEM